MNSKQFDMNDGVFEMDGCDVFNGKVLFFNEINGTGYIEQEFSTEKLRFTYKNIIKEGYRAVFEGQPVLYGTRKVGTGTKVAFVKVVGEE